MAALIDSVMQNSTTQVVAVSGTSTPTANGFIGSGPFAMVEIATTVGIHMKAGQSPVATPNDAYYPAGMVIVKKINSGEKIAFIKAAGAADGTVTVTQQV